MHVPLVVFYPEAHDQPEGYAGKDQHAYLFFGARHASPYLATDSAGYLRRLARVATELADQLEKDADLRGQGYKPRPDHDNCPEWVPVGGAS